MSSQPRRSSPLSWLYRAHLLSTMQGRNNPQMLNRMQARDTGGGGRRPPPMLSTTASLSASLGPLACSGQDHRHTNCFGCCPRHSSCTCKSPSWCDPPLLFWKHEKDTSDTQPPSPMLTPIKCLLVICLCMHLNLSSCSHPSTTTTTTISDVEAYLGMEMFANGTPMPRHVNHAWNETTRILNVKHFPPRKTRSSLAEESHQYSRKKLKKLNKKTRKKETKVIAVPSALISSVPIVSSPLRAWSKSEQPWLISALSPLPASQQMSGQSSQIKPPYVRSNDLGDDKPAAKNITAQVSWIRVRDFHLLTIGTLTYIQDDRFALRYKSDQHTDWALQIKDVTVKDEDRRQAKGHTARAVLSQAYNMTGLRMRARLYECQINSDPPRSQYYYLHVVVPVSSIIGNPDIFVRLNSPINLTCLISSSPEPPSFVFWYHNNRMINYDYDTLSQGQISVQKDPNKADVVISRLFIKKAKLDDSGNYTCSPSNAQPASAYVHVLQGEKRLSSNQIQNDWTQTEQTLTNEGHHSGQASQWTAPTPSRCFIHMTMFIVLFLLTCLFTF